MTSYSEAWLVAFVFTELVEAPIYRRMLACSFGLGLAPSALTHPILWFVLFPRLHLPYAQKVLISELFVVLVESLCAYAWLRSDRKAALPAAFGGHRAGYALWAACAANAASLGLGLLSRQLFGMP
jgi:hypothetical protein